MKAFAACAVLLLIVPMAVVNPLGRDGFLGYYAGVVAMWGAVVLTSGAQSASSVKSS